LRQFLQIFGDCLQEPDFDPSEIPIVCQHVNILLSNKWKGKSDELNPLLKENVLENILNGEDIDNITLLGVIAQRFYMHRSMKELNDIETRMGIEIKKMITKSKRPDAIKHICRYLLGEEFGHELFVLSEASESPCIQAVSIILHLCCLVATKANENSIWYSCLLNQSVSSIELLPCATLPVVTAAEHMVIRILTDSVVIGSMGFNFTTSNALLNENKFTADPSRFFVNDLLNLLSDLERLLQMNSSDVCLLIHMVIFKCQDLITQKMAVSSKAVQSKHFESRYVNTIETILKNRFQVIHDSMESTCMVEMGASCIEAYVDETAEITTENCMDGLLMILFRKSQISSKDTFVNQLLIESGEHLFLNLVFNNRKQLAAPKFITSLLRWHMSVVTYASYKFRKVDFKDLTVQKFFSLELDDIRRNILKKHFDQFKRSWNEIREKFLDVLNSDVTKDMEPMTLLVKMEACIVLNDDSTVLLLLKELVNIHNSFLNQSTDVKEKGMKQIKIEMRKLPLLDVKPNDVIAFEWNEDWLRFSQCETEYGFGRKVNFDFEKIEDEVKKDILYGKSEIQFPASFPKPIFTDDLFQNSVELLSEIEACIPQQYLTTEIRKSVELKVDRDGSFVTDLLSHLGMVLSLLKKTGGDNSQPLIEYLEKWQTVTGMNSNIFKRILPEPIDSVKLGHVVTLYKWLEELNGESLVETLDEAYHKLLPTEAKDFLQKIKKSHIIHLEKLQHPLLVFVHRCLALKKINISTDHTLSDYISSSDLWWKEDFYKKSIVAGPDKKVILLTDILSPLILIEHVCETVQFVHDAVREAKKVDVRISTITTDFQKMKKTQPKTSTRKNTARRYVMFEKL
ncbi:hypothetical protein AM593_09786, partial [Mytilus galloprovincialis]